MGKVRQPDATGIIMDHHKNDDPSQHLFVRYYPSANRPAAEAETSYNRIVRRIPKSSLVLGNPKKTRLKYNQDGKSYPGTVYDIFMN